MSRSTVDVRSLLSREDQQYLDLLGPKYAMFSGWTLKHEDDDDDDDDDPDDDDDDDLDPETVLKVGDKSFKVSELQGIMAREKRQGKKAGQVALAKELGFDSVDAMKAAVKKKPVTPKPAPKDGQDDEAAERAAEREAAAAEREERAARAERKADLKGVLRDHGVSRDDLPDVLALLDREVSAEYDDDDLEDAVEELKRRRPAFFGSTDDDEDDAEQRPTPKVKARIPEGRPKSKNRPPKAKFGQGGLERAKRRGWVANES